MTEPRAALDAIGLLPDVEIDIADAALQLARVDAPDRDWIAARAHLSELAREAVQLGASLPQDDFAGRREGLAEIISRRHDYQGDTETYDDLANANLIHVIERRRGLPVALGILWLHCARAAGWQAHGVDFPGHFLLALEGERGPAVIDVFAGGVAMDARALRALLKSVEGAKAELRPGLLQPMNVRSVLLRLQQNIKVRRLRAGRLEAAVECVEDMLRIAPIQASLWREAALIHQRLDQIGAALRCFERFLELVPQGEASVSAKAAMDELRARLN
jgi:regulator of sirC expression with transglutaminase-like and TPR domain